MKLLYILLLIVFSLVSCKSKRIAQPELQDLIYKDILSDINVTEKVIQLRETEIQVVKEEIKGLHTRAPEKQVKLSRIKSMTSDNKRFKQLKKYLEIKLNKRKVYSRILHELNLNNNHEWPDQDEYSEYLKQKDVSFLPVKEINKADNSRELTHKKNVGDIMQKHGL